MERNIIIYIILVGLLLIVSCLVSYSVGNANRNNKCLNREYANDLVDFSNQLVDGYNICYDTNYKHLKNIEVE